MILIIQIKSLFLSFIYGIFFKYTFNLNKKLLTHKNIYYKILINFLFTFNHSLLFFILLKKINNFSLHLYMFISFLLGLLFYDYYFTHKNN